MDDELEAGTDQVAFEDGGLGLTRWLRTIGQAFRPSYTAESFASSQDLLAPSLFFLSTWLPLVLLQGVMPFTHHFHFKSSFGVEIARLPQAALIADVGRALSINLFTQTLCFGIFVASFSTLAGAFSGQTPRTSVPDGELGLRRIGLRAVLYRAFLWPLGGNFSLIASALLWGVPEAAAETVAPIALLSSVASSLFLLVGLRETCRKSMQIGGLTTLLVLALPLLLSGVLEQVLIGGESSMLADWLPLELRSSAPPAN